MQDIEAEAAVNVLDVDLLVVGGGPVGMTAALAAAARGLRVAIVERRTGTSDEPKAISLDDESLRLYQAAGVVDQVLGIVVPGTGTAYYDADGQFLFRAGTGEPCRHGYPFKNPFAQPDLERVLYEAMVADAGIAVHFSSELVGLEQGQDAAHARLETPAGTLDIDASYVIAADGGRSTVRQLFDISMAGRSFEDVWLVVDTVGDVRRERYGMHHGEPSRPHVIVPGLHGRCRYEFYLSPAEAAEVNDEPGFELIKRLVAPYRAISPEEVERAVAYRFHALNATRWRVGRVFLAGDAAHMMPPFAGQGLNSGLRDVANLVWKIDEAIRKPRSEEFLDSYQAERYPHASAVIASSVRLGRVVMTTSDRLARLRDKTIRRALATEDGREFFTHMRYRPVARFDRGLVVEDGTGSGLVGAQLGQPQIFDFARHRICRFDEVLGSGWALLAVGVAAATVSARSAELPELRPRVIAIPLDDLMDEYGDDVEVAIDVDGRLYDELEAARGRFVLIRPDRFVAAVWRDDDWGPIRDACSRWAAERAPARPASALVEVG
jgi:3-(3-hydroxy-phenyl)propionate hydroxylase